MVTVDEFEPFVSLYAPNIPSEYVQHAIRETINDFMRATKVAVDTVRFEKQKFVDDYVLDLPEGRNLVSVIDVKHRKEKNCKAGSFIEVVNQPGMRGYEVFDDYDGFPAIEFFQDIPAGNTVEVKYSWVIGRNDCEIPSFIYEKYMDIIVAGSLARLYRIPNVEWFNMQVALKYDEEFKSGLLGVKIKKTGGRKKLGSIFSRRRFL